MNTIVVSILDTIFQILMDKRYQSTVQQLILKTHLVSQIEQPGILVIQVLVRNHR